MVATGKVDGDHLLATERTTESTVKRILNRALMGIMHLMRHQAESILYRSIVEELISHPENADTRDTEAILRLCTAYLKLLFPHVRKPEQIDVNEFYKYCLAPSIRMRSIMKIEIEVRSFDELQQVLDHGGVDRIMLDNFSVPDTKKAVDIIGGRYETESSGGITFETIRDYAEQGVDFISVGALTHSVKGLDMSFKAC